MKQKPSVLSALHGTYEKNCLIRGLIAALQSTAKICPCISVPTIKCLQPWFYRYRMALYEQQLTCAELPHASMDTQHQPWKVHNIKL